MSTGCQREELHHVFPDGPGVVMVFGPGWFAQVTDVRVGKVVDRWRRAIVVCIGHDGNVPARRIPLDEQDAQHQATVATIQRKSGLLGTTPVPRSERYQRSSPSSVSLSCEIDGSQVTGKKPLI